MGPVGILVDVLVLKFAATVTLPCLPPYPADVFVQYPT